MFNTNLKYLRQKNKFSQQELAEAMGIPRTTLGDYERGKTEPSLEMLVKLSEHFDVRLDDLLRKNLSHEDLEILRNKDLRVLAITVDSENRGNIELVDTKAEAGYLDSFHDPEYISELPKISFPSVPEGTYRGFEIRGDSMLPVESGSMVICSYVEHLDHIKNGRTYIIVSKQEGVVYKRIRHDKEKHQLVLISDNEMYLPYAIPYDEIGEIWQYYAHVSFSDSKRSHDNMLEDKINDIQIKVKEMHSNMQKILE